MCFSGLSVPLVGVLLVVLLLNEKSLCQDYPSHNNLSCTDTETQCAKGCCPFPDAVCCLDGYECCQHGKVCIPYVGICLGLDSKDGFESSLISTRTTPVSLAASCPKRSTTCGELCCLLPEANCCADGLHCCPHGYRCDLPNKRCIQSSQEYRVLNAVEYFLKGPKYQVTEEIRQAVPKEIYQTCPDGIRMCAKHQNCCIEGDGSWRCCPKPFLGAMLTAGECCMSSIFGILCCPENFTCSDAGCF